MNVGFLGASFSVTAALLFAGSADARAVCFPDDLLLEFADTIVVEGVVDSAITGPSHRVRVSGAPGGHFDIEVRETAATIRITRILRGEPADWSFPYTFTEPPLGCGGPPVRDGEKYIFSLTVRDAATRTVSVHTRAAYDAVAGRELRPRHDPRRPAGWPEAFKQ